MRVVRPAIAARPPKERAMTAKLIDESKGKWEETTDAGLTIWYFDGKGENKKKEAIAASKNINNFQNLVTATRRARLMAEAAGKALETASAVRTTILKNHFANPSPSSSDLEQIWKNYQRIQKGLVNITICDARGRASDSRGFVNKNTKYDYHGNIHINFAILDYHEDSVARTIVHEASHKFADTLDVAYAGASSYPPKDAIENADSYAWAALSFLIGRLVIPHNFYDALGFSE
jgi:hypothetical protein